MVKAKVQAAQNNINGSGLAEYVHILEGDATLTLSKIEGNVDMLIIDGFPDCALEILKIMIPKLRAGAIVLADNIKTFKSTLTDYLNFVKASENGFVSYTMPFKDGTEFSIKL